MRKLRASSAVWIARQDFCDNRISRQPPKLQVVGSNGNFLKVPSGPFFIMDLKEFYLKHEKWFLILIVAVVFCSVYFPINYLTQFRTTYQLSIFIDHLIPFLPLTIFVYQLVYIFWFLPYFLVKEIRPLRKLTLSYSLLMIISGLIFLLFPVKVIRPEIAVNNFVDWLTATFFSLDLPYNGFPSIHASFTFLVGFFSFKYLKQLGLVLYLIAIFIIAATLTLKQHYFLDAAAGMALALPVYFWVFRK